MISNEIVLLCDSEEVSQSEQNAINYFIDYCIVYCENGRVLDYRV